VNAHGVRIEASAVHSANGASAGKVTALHDVLTCFHGK
jgi:hypothetical protein